MDEQEERELGITTVILKQFTERTLPEVLWIKEKLDKGECLSEGDIEFLQRIFENAQKVTAETDNYPEYQSLYSKAIELYEEITAKALENEQAAVAQEGGTDV
jgi:hypothetical protein